MTMSSQQLFSSQSLISESLSPNLCQQAKSPIKSLSKESRLILKGFVDQKHIWRYKCEERLNERLRGSQSSIVIRPLFQPQRRLLDRNMASGTPQRLIILMWKNLLLKRRHYIQTALEIFIPTLLYLGIVLIRLNGGDELHPQPRDAQMFRSSAYPEVFCLSFTDLRRGSMRNVTLGYTQRSGSRSIDEVPDSKLVRDLMRDVKKAINGFLWPLCQSIGEAAKNNATKNNATMNNATMNNATDTSNDEVEEDDSSPIYPGKFTVKYFENEDAIIEEGRRQSAESSSGPPDFLGGIVFKENFEYIYNNKDNNDNKKLVPNLDYTIRFLSDYAPRYTARIFPIVQLSGPARQHGASYSTFVSVQNLVDLVYTELATNNKLIPKSLFPPSPVFKDLHLTSTQELAYPAYLYNDFAVFVGILLPMFTVLSFCFLVPPMLKRIVHEKESGVKELMKLMGLPSWMHWLSWFLNSVLTSTGCIVIMVGLVCIEWAEGTGKVLDFSNPLAIFLFLSLYAMALSASLFALSAPFETPNLALAMGVVFHLVTYVAPSAIIDNETYSTLDPNTKIGLAIFPNIALWWGFNVLTSEEGKGRGLQFYSLNSRIDPKDPVTMAVIFSILVFDTIFYMILAWYIDNVKPGQYGVAKPFYFPLLPSYWGFGGRSSRVSPLSSRSSSSSTSVRKNYFETEPQLPAGIVVRHLKKTFRSFKTDVLAVKDVTFSAFQGQITALLGHNGAGKTTTMSVLSGIYSPSGGEGLIDGKSIYGEMNEIRSCLGLCPQHNMLFADLTVHEHFVFFAMLKGLSMSEARSESLRYVGLLRLEPKADVMVTNLSGGMKRKVNLGIALLGDSRVVMLDEPTSGMDPENRRVIWDLLVQLKRDRTMLLTTHFMEEADVLGDRIAIMADGEVRCCGSSLFLKKRFGRGYTLTMTQDAQHCDLDGVEHLVTSVVEGASLESDTGGELVFNLPDEKTNVFARLFEKLERRRGQLGVLNFGLSVTTMEDVFLRVGAISHDQQELDSKKNDDLNHRDRTLRESEEGIEALWKLTGLALWMSRMRALITKRCIYTWRRNTLYVVLALAPMAMAALTQWSVNLYKEPVSEFPALHFDLSPYTEPVLFIEKQPQDSGWANNLSNCYAAFVKGQHEYVEVARVKNISEEVIKRGHGDIATYRESFVAGALFAENVSMPNMSFPVSFKEVRAVYNTVPNHARPLAHNLMMNSWLRAFFLNQSDEQQDQKPHTISTSSHPLPQEKTIQFKNLATQLFSPVPFAFALSIPTGIGIFVAAFLIFPQQERITNAKQVQLMTGLRPITFWLSNVIVDFLMYTMAITAAVVVLVIMDAKQTFTSSWEALGGLILILALHGFGGMLMSYVISLFVKTAASGYAVITLINILTGGIGPIAVWVLRFVGRTSDDFLLFLLSDTIRFVFSIFPPMPLARSMLALVQVQEENNLCTTGVTRDTLEYLCNSFKTNPFMLVGDQRTSNYGQCCREPFVDASNVICDKVIFPGVNVTECHVDESIFTWDQLKGVNADVLILVLDILFYAFLLLAMDTQLLSRLRLAWARDSWKSTERLDTDVQREQRRVKQLMLRDGASVDDVLLVDNLRKSFGNFHAVQGLTIGVKNGECFGLLGINGAGKTTTFRMLTGDEVRSGGDAFLLGKKLSTQRSGFLRQIGYCPQFDSIIELLTGREMLTLMARLRGLSESSVSNEIERWMRILGISEYADRRCGQYSGGNKRKLNVAMALMADPAILFLDEPSTGVDPVARRRLWNVIASLRNNGKSIVLTSHSMEECEALCNRLAIMVNGQFRCLGGPQHLKKKFAQGFTILIKLNTRDMRPNDALRVTNDVKNQMEKSFNDLSIKDEHKDYMHYHVEDTSASLHKLFATMEGMKRGFKEVMEDYCVSETTLEQVFLSFAKSQRQQTRQRSVSESDSLSDDGTSRQLKKFSKDISPEIKSFDQPRLDYLPRRRP